MKNYRGASISPERIKYIEYAIGFLQEYRKFFKSDISKQHKIFKVIQVLEKLIYK